MTPLILYFIKVNIALAILYLFYKWLFAKDTFFGLRRLMLIVIYVSAFAYPAFSLFEWIPKANETAMGMVSTYYSQVFPEIFVTPAEAVSHVTDYSWVWVMFFIAYVTGVILLSCRIIFAFVKIGKVICSCPKQSINHIQFYELPDPQEPYSFFKWICLYPANHTAEQLEEILIHEQTHANEWHSVDMILAQSIAAICWLNPFVWLMRNEIRMNHEYLADKRVVKTGCDKKAYQYHLLGIERQLPAAANLYNNFSVLPLKKRIKMLNKRRTRNIMKSKYLMFLPVVAVLIFFSNCGNKASVEQLEPGVSGVLDTLDVATVPITETPDVVLADTVFDVAEEMPEFPGGMQNLMKFLTQNIKYPATALSNKEQGRVIVQFVVTKEGKICDAKVVRSISPELDKEALRAIDMMPLWKPGKQKGKPVNVKYTVPIAFRIP